MDAIVYTSNTGSTARLARMLGEELRLPVCQLGRALNDLPENPEIIYLGWLKAGRIQGLAKAAKHCRLAAVAAVGLNASNGQLEQVRQQNALRREMPLFLLQGAYDRKKLHGLNRLIMTLAEKKLIADMQTHVKEDPTLQDTIDMLKNGGDRVSREELQPLIDWYLSREGQS